MKKLLAILMLAAVSGILQAGDTVRMDATSYPFDETAPRIVNDAPVGWGSTSWQGPATGKSNYHVMNTDITSGMSVNLEDLFGVGHATTVADIASISYYTKNEIGNANQDWWLTIYTEKENDTADSGSWYDSRLHAHPDVTSTAYVPGDWNLWSTDASGATTNQLAFYDSQRGFNGYHTLDELGNGTVTWNNGSHDYSAESILSITLQSDSGWNGFNGYVDGLTITLNNGNVGEVNFGAPVPAPGAFLLGSIGVACVGWIKRRRCL